MDLAVHGLHTSTIIFLRHFPAHTAPTLSWRAGNDAAAATQSSRAADGGTSALQRGLNTTNTGA
jgi:hypothetical protein